MSIIPLPGTPCIIVLCWDELSHGDREEPRAHSFSTHGRVRIFFHSRPHHKIHPLLAQVDARLVHTVWESLGQSTPIYVIAIYHAEVRRLAFRYTQEDAETIRELFSDAPRDFVTVDDVPWMNAAAYTRG